MMNQSFTPAVSCLLIPLDQNNRITPPPALEMFLATSDDYALGKLFRTGTDAVYGFSRRGRRIYNANDVRTALKTIDDHLRTFNQRYAKKKIIGRQGHGNIGMNNNVVAVIADQYGKITQMIVPAGEPIHERMYPSFIKRGVVPAACYEIADVMYFYVKNDNDTRLTYDSKQVDSYINRNPARPQPDREMSNNQVFLPVWKTGITLSRTMLRDQRIDTTKMEFVEVQRNAMGTIDTAFLPNIKVATVIENEQTGEITPTPIDDLRFVFFGIPVHTLGGNAASSGKLAEIVHYFYDLRHIFDLGSLPARDREFYVFEYALKKNLFEKATQLLRANPARINLRFLYNQLRRNNASPRVINAVRKCLTNASTLQTLLESKGYRRQPSPRLIRYPGDFYFEIVKRSLLSVTVNPLRNVYPYSFIGIIVVDTKKYLLLAVTSGMNGVRSGANIFTRPPFTAGYTLEESVRAIENELKKLYGTSFESFLDSPSNQLLLLDQGGDVHQWIGVGGVNMLVGSSQDRAKLSAELIVAT